MYVKNRAIILNIYATVCYKQVMKCLLAYFSYYCICLPFHPKY